MKEKTKENKEIYRLVDEIKDGSCETKQKKNVSGEKRNEQR